MGKLLFKRERKSGFTLMELLVAMTIFLVVIGISGGIFVQTLRTQRIVTQISEALNNVTSALEQMAREMRTGFFFSSDGEKISFFNASGQSITYELEEDSIKRCIGFPSPEDCKAITASWGSGETAGVRISDLHFYIVSELADHKPPLVTITSTVVAARDIEVNLQTSVSSRIIDS